MTTKLKLTLVAAGICGAGLMLPNIAQAKKPGVLVGKPIVVDKLQLRKLRLQVTPQIGMSLSQPYVHKGFAGAKIRFDFNDWLGVRGKFDYAVISLESKLLEALNDPGGLPCAQTSGGDVDCGSSAAMFRPDDQSLNPAPLRHDMQAGLTSVQWQSSFGLAFTPFAGKLGLFSSIFTEYDIYLFGGIGMNSWEQEYGGVKSTSERLGIENYDDPNGSNYCVDSNGKQNDECLLHPVLADTGVRVGASFGGGLHLFLTDWAALNLEVENVMVAQNDPGLNGTISDVPPRVENKSSRSGGDRVLRHNVTFNLGITFYIPPRAKRSRIKRN